MTTTITPPSNEKDFNAMDFYQKKADDTARKAVEKCYEYSDDEETLNVLIYDLTIKMTRLPDSLPPWSDENGQRVATYSINVSRGQYKPYTFNFYDSIRNTEILNNNDLLGDRKRKNIKLRKEIKESYLYTVLSCIRCEYYCEPLFSDWCDCFGYDEDSRKAFDLWQVCLKHSQELQKSLRLSDDELNSLPS